MTGRGRVQHSSGQVGLQECAQYAGQELVEVQQCAGHESSQYDSHLPGQGTLTWKWILSVGFGAATTVNKQCA